MNIKLICVICFSLLFLNCEHPGGLKKIFRQPQNILSEKRIEKILKDYYSSSPNYADPALVNYDERLKSLNWSNLVLVHNITPKISVNNEWYYVAAGTLANGQILAAQTVHAVTGKFIHGQNFSRADSDVVRFATKNEILEYSRNYLSGDLDAVPVYFNDGSLQTASVLHCWKYLVFTVKEGKSISELSDYVLLDPWIRQLSKDVEINPENVLTARCGSNHRAFQFSDASFLDDAENIFGKITLKPID